jgi:hypothetical protein
MLQRCPEIEQRIAIKTFRKASFDIANMRSHFADGTIDIVARQQIRYHLMLIAGF